MHCEIAGFSIRQRDNLEIVHRPGFQAIEVALMGAVGVLDGLTNSVEGIVGAAGDAEIAEVALTVPLERDGPAGDLPLCLVDGAFDWNA